MESDPNGTTLTVKYFKNRVLEEDTGWFICQLMDRKSITYVRYVASDNH